MSQEQTYNIQLPGLVMTRLCIVGAADKGVNGIKTSLDAVHHSQSECPAAA